MVHPNEWATSTENDILITIMVVYIVQGVWPKDKGEKREGARP